jgi:hypothetical protein
VSPVRYELGFYIPEDDILRSHRREKLHILHKQMVAEDRDRTETKGNVRLLKPLQGNG